MLAAHVIFGAYGFWLPNDPRGSWSTFVGAWELFRYGTATKTTTRRSVAAAQHNRATRLAAKRALVRPAVQLTGEQALAVSRGRAQYADRARVKILACAILPDHVHLVLGSHRIAIPQLVIQLKGEATSQLIADRMHPFQQLAAPGARPPKCFARGQWKVYLDSVGDVQRAVQYVEDNPQKEGKRRQRWSFVTPWDGW
jgi:REP element-mobilizing transposase RayT